MSGERRARVAAIDIGSNSIRLLVADVPEDDGPLQTHARVGEPCRLGRGLHRNGLIEDAIAARAGDLARDFVRRARHLGAGRILVCATAALREASNGLEVAGQIAERCGRPVRVLSGAEEARLVYAAVVRGLGPAATRSPCVVFDLGGGSTEVVSGLGPESGRWVSLPFGAVHLTERFLGSDPPAADQVAGLVAHVDRVLADGCAGMPESTPVLAGVGGTVTAFGMLDRGATANDPAQIEGWLIEAPRLEALVERMLGSTAEERRRWNTLGTGREDIIVAGALAVRCLFRRFPSRGLLCSTQGLRYGLARLAGEALLRGDEEVFPR